MLRQVFIAPAASLGRAGKAGMGMELPVKLCLGNALGLQCDGQSAEPSELEINQAVRMGFWVAVVWQQAGKARSSRAGHFSQVSSERGVLFSVLLGLHGWCLGQAYGTGPGSPPWRRTEWADIGRTKPSSMPLCRGRPSC